MLKDVLRLILFFSVQDDHFEWLTICKEWYKVGTNLEIFKKKRTNHDLSIFLKTLTMVPRENFSTSFTIQFGDQKLDIGYDQRDKNGEYWFIEGVKGIDAKPIQIRSVELSRTLMLSFLNEKKCQSILSNILDTHSGIIVLFSRCGIINNYPSGYKLIDDLVFKGIISIIRGHDQLEQFTMNMNVVLKHYLENKEMYPQFAEQHKKNLDKLKEGRDKYQKNKKSSKCIVM